MKHGKYTFEIVNRIPKGYIVWNIGDNMIDGYIPLCELTTGYNINPNTLKAIGLVDAEVKILRDAAHYGICDLKKAKAAARINAVTHYGNRKKTLGEAAVKIFERITA